MPQEEIYQSQVGPRTAAPLPMADANDFGAAIGQAVEQLGGQMHQQQVRAYQIKRQQLSDQQQAEFARRFAELRSTMDTRARSLRDNSQPGAVAHVEGATALLKDASATLLDGIDDDAVRARAEAQYADYAGRFMDGEATWADGARISHMVRNVGMVTETSANRARQNPEAFREELQSGNDAIDALEGVPGDVREQLRRAHEQSVTIGFLNGVVETNPQTARAMIDAGTFNAVLSPEQAEQLRNGADVEIRRAQAAAEHERAVQTAQVREQIATLRAMAGQGVDISAQLPAAIQAATAIGDTSAAVELEGLQADNQYSRIYGNQTPVARQEAAARLARIARPSATQQRELRWLQEHAPTLDNQFNSDPVGYLASRGVRGSQPPPLDPNNPQSVAARQEWAAVATRTYGRPIPVLSDNEAQTLRARAQQSPAGQVEVANQLAQFRYRDALQAARQVAPGDGMLQVMIGLGQADRAAVRDGAEARRGNAALIDGANGTRARALFNRSLGRAAALMDPQVVNAAFEAASSIYALDASRHGNPAYSDDRFAAYVARGLGTQIGRWHGETVLLPRGVSARAFENRLAVHQVSNGPNGPVLRSGQPMTADQLRQYTPRARPDGLYEFHDEQDRPVMARSGAVYTIAVWPAGGRR